MVDELKAFLKVILVGAFIAATIASCTAHQNAMNTKERIAIRTAVANSSHPIEAGCGVGIVAAQTCLLLTQQH